MLRSPASNRGSENPRPGTDEHPPDHPGKTGTSTTSWGKAPRKLAHRAKVRRENPTILAQTRCLKVKSFPWPDSKHHRKKSASAPIAQMAPNGWAADGRSPRSPGACPIAPLHSRTLHSPAANSPDRDSHAPQSAASPVPSILSTSSTLDLVPPAGTFSESHAESTSHDSS